MLKGESMSVGGGMNHSLEQETVGVSEWRAGGTMLFAAMILYSCSANALTVVASLVRTLTAEFGWTRASIASATLITASGTLIFAPWVGALVDRGGPRRVALVALVVLIVATMTIGLTGPSITSWYLAWCLFAFAQACAGNVVWANAVVSRFDRHRGMALSILLSGQAASYGLLPMFAIAVIQHFGWRMVYFILAGYVALIGWPLAWAFFYSASDLARRDPASGCKPSPKPARGGTFRAMRRRHFWHIAVGYAIAASAVSSLMFHFQPILTDGGMTPLRAAAIASMLGPTSLAGRFLSGFLLDRFPPNYVATWALMLPGLCYLILIFVGTSDVAAFAIALIIGIAAGAETDVLAYLVSRYFGPQYFSSLYGLLLGIFAVGYGIGPVMTGAVFDRLGSYAPSFVLLALAAATGSLLMFSMGQPPSQEQLAQA
jgi:predicted MFS family arabinose efflux permease